MRILHLEDSLLEKGVDTSALLSNISNHKYKVSLKWDGSPAFVAGRYLGAPFVTLKNWYWRREQLILRDDAAIDAAIESEDLRKKMKLIFKYLASHGDEFIEGDFLFSPEMVENGQFQPNTVRYELEDAHLWKIGVAIHTVHGGNLPYKNDRLVEQGVMLADTHPEIEYSIEPISTRQFDGLTNSQKAAFKKWVNSRIRAGNMNLMAEDFAEYDDSMTRHVMTYVDEWQTLMNEYMMVAEWKNQVLKSMKVESNIQPAENHFHEGLVIDTGEKLVKLVNRLHFSHLNFNKERHGR